MSKFLYETKIYFPSGILKGVVHVHARMLGCKNCFKGATQFAGYPRKVSLIQKHLRNFIGSFN